MDNIEYRLDWIPFYETFATKLLEYKDNRTVLIQKMQKVYHEINISFPKLEADGVVEDIDPFTVFGMFNKGITNKNRTKILTGIANEFDINIEVPANFDGIPVLNNTNASFVHFKKARGDNDIDDLWSVFEIAINYTENQTDENRNLFEKAYNKAITISGVKWNLTMGLYWIRPYVFLNLDGKNRDYLK